MSGRKGELLEALAAVLGKLPAVFSTPQWGGRAYKLPGRAGSRSKPKLLAFVGPRDEQDGISVQFKLPKERAAAVIDEHDWIQRHSFSSLGGAGWVDVTITRRGQVPVVRELLRESHSLHGIERPAPAVGKPRIRSGDRTDPVARRIAAVMREQRPDGWAPDPDGRSDQ